jgi:DNA-binding HxlR family transcriptional regulator
MGVANMPVPKTERDCKGFAEVLSRVGDKWTIMVIGALSDGSMRYSVIRRRIGSISQRMLTLTLRGLERDGLLTRTVYPTIPPRVDYELTELGYSLVASLKSLHDWATRHNPAIASARRRFAEGQAAGSAPPREAVGDWRALNEATRSSSSRPGESRRKR